MSEILFIFMGLGGLITGLGLITTAQSIIIVNRLDRLEQKIDKLREGEL